MENRGISDAQKRFLEDIGDQLCKLGDVSTGKAIKNLASTNITKIEGSVAIEGAILKRLELRNRISFEGLLKIGSKPETMS